jgi:transposase
VAAPLTALAFLATIDQPGRFRKSHDIGEHLVLTPRRHQSDETDTQGHSLLIRSTMWSALRAWGVNIA